ncbi:hypothetical protein PHMEG_000501 [Phytophthora megakarya]|uniref:Uncharacterized protein n=1 Tax=Phytophthora megakarya TaxID=4795 RepID=A0A225X3E6_9STRA|nr:hypothetical protein PHMEG_000501 [Phytophthora megakarya]
MIFPQDLRWRAVILLYAYSIPLETVSLCVVWLHKRSEGCYINPRQQETLIKLFLRKQDHGGQGNAHVKVFQQNKNLQHDCIRFTLVQNN